MIKSQIANDDAGLDRDRENDLSRGSESQVYCGTKMYLFLYLSSVELFRRFAFNERYTLRPEQKRQVFNNSDRLLDFNVYFVIKKLK